MGVPVHVNGFNKVHEDVRLRRALVFPLRLVNGIVGLRLSPLTVVASTSKNRVIHNLTFASSPSNPGANADTDSSTAPARQLGHVLREVVWRILYFRRKYGVGAHIVLSKTDVEDAFRQVTVEWGAAADVWIRILRHGSSRQAAEVWVAQQPGVLVPFCVCARTLTRQHFV